MLLRTLTLMLLLARFAGAQSESLDREPEADAELEIGLRFWVADEGNTKLRTMEQEAIAKGGKGEGTTFRYNSVGLEEPSVIPEVEIGARLADHAIRLSWFRSVIEADTILEEDLEFDGDLLFAGDVATVSSDVQVVQITYLYLAIDGELRVELGLAAAWYAWQFEILRSEGRIQNGDYSSTSGWRGYFVPMPAARFRYSPGDLLHGEAELVLGYATAIQSSRDRSGNSNGFIRVMAGLVLETKWLKIRLDAGYTMIDVVAFEHNDEADLFSYRMLGLRLGLELRF